MVAGCVQILQHDMDAVTFRAVVFEMGDDRTMKILWQSNDDEVLYESSKRAVRVAYKQMCGMIGGPLDKRKASW